MDSIKFNAKGHSVEFSKRTLTIDGKVYSYTGISQVKHSSAYQAYLFRYNNEWVKLFYDEPHANVVAALFRKINAMNARRAAKARATQSIDTAAIAAALAASEEEEPAAKEEEPAAKEEAPKPEPVPIPAVTPVLELEPTVEEPAEEPAAEEPVEEPAEKPAEEPAEKPAEESAPEAKPEEVIAQAEEAKVKKAKRKKAFIIFAIIIALFVVAGIIYFLTVGTTNDASQGPNIDETHQYNDIEELIEEMQE